VSRRLFKRVGRRFVVQINLQFEPRDIWVGAFWRVSDAGLFHLYLCLLPLLPLHLTVMDRGAR
jgi:hypothetical protein